MKDHLSRPMFPGSPTLLKYTSEESSEQIRPLGRVPVPLTVEKTTRPARGKPSRPSRTSKPSMATHRASSFHRLA